VELRPDPFYMSKQSMITESMRTILVDWLVDVSMHFEVMSETLHFAISYIDRTLSLLEIEKNKLQLVGVTCMKIADLFNEKSKEYYRQENASEYAYITADEYTSDEVIVMEKQILTLLDFNCFSPTVPHFLKLVEVPKNVEALSYYIADLMLLTTKPLTFKPSLIASAILYLSCGALNNFITPNDKEVYRTLFGCYSFSEFSSCVRVIQRCWADVKTSLSNKHEAVNTKHENQHNIDFKEIKIPSIALNKLESWYSALNNIPNNLYENDEMQTD